jgi:hypothetical protein
VQYSPVETATWKTVYRKAYELFPGRACTTHRKVLEVMKKECGYSEDNIPQMEDISQYLKSDCNYGLFKGKQIENLLFCRDFRFFPSPGRRPRDGPRLSGQPGFQGVSVHAVHEAQFQSAPLSGAVS